MSYDLYGGMPPHVDTETSKEAAEAIESVSESMRHQVLAHISKAGYRGCTDDELETTLNMRPNTARPRRRELVLLGLVVASGIKRQTRSGRKAIVWVTPHYQRVGVDNA